MNTTEFFKKRFDQMLQANGQGVLKSVRVDAFDDFNRLGIPTAKNEEWKYTRIGNLFNKEYNMAFPGQEIKLDAVDLDKVRLPGHENANELIFINGRFSFSLSVIRSKELVVLPLEDAAKNEYSTIVSQHFGHSRLYAKDGIHALNTALMHGGVFIHIRKGNILPHPIYIYNVCDARSGNILAMPRSLVHIGENAEVQFVETFCTLGKDESFTNRVMEIVMEKDCRVEYYKLQNDAEHTHQVSTTHIRQVGKSFLHTVVISLQGGIIRNNLNVLLEADQGEAHLYGLYFPIGHTHIDNHTLVDNIKPGCLSNEFYKGILDGHGTGVFNGKIMVQPLAQKTNAYQSNKNILLSNSATVNAKPQLEIFADDVKCSHGCTVGRLNEEGLFYLRSRGIPEKMARSLLVHAFAIDILEHIRPEAIRRHVDYLISKRLEFPSLWRNREII